MQYGIAFYTRKLRLTTIVSIVRICINIMIVTLHQKFVKSYTGIEKIICLKTPVAYNNYNGRIKHFFLVKFINRYNLVLLQLQAQK